MQLRCVLIVTLAVVFAGTAFGGEYETPHHSLVRVHGRSAEHEKQIFRYTRLDLLPGGTPGEIWLAALPGDLEFLVDHGYSYDVIHMDLEDFYMRRSRAEGHLDDMGGFKTLAEIGAALDTMHAHFPLITTAKFSIGNSLQSRPIWGMKISDNPDVDENELELWYNALIHAREPEGMEVVIYFMNYLLSHYGTDPVVTDLVDHREFFFTPCVNPDGYEFNRLNNPNGNGIWRKNRRTNGDGSIGVDLNRNFGYTWGLDDEGSSPFGSDETYRGTAAFSEPETQAMRDFVNSRHFVGSLDYHTYSNYILYPWGSDYFQGNGLSPDNSIFELLADSMAYYIQQVNDSVYLTGTPWQLLYNANGGSFDWEYGDTTQHEKMFSMTTEVGSPFTDGFWPAPSRIVPLAAENLPANLFFARYAEKLAPPELALRVFSYDQSEQTGDGDGVLEAGETFILSVALENSGLQELTGLAGELSTTDPYATIQTGTVSWPPLAHGANSVSPGPFVVAIGNYPGSVHGFSFLLHVTSLQGLDTIVTVGAVAGNPIFTDDVENGSGNWSSTGTGSLWHVSTRRSASPSHSWYSGNESSGLYGNSMNASLVTPSVTLPEHSLLRFAHWYDLESNADFGWIELNWGNGWQLVAGPYTGTSNGWRLAEISLSSFPAGAAAQLRFRMITDATVTHEGWYLDNLEIVPPPHAAISPAAVTAAASPGNDAVKEVIIENTGYGDLVFTTGFANGSAVTDTSAADAYGYRWQDSGGPCGPQYAWLPIDSLGTHIVFVSGQGDAVKGPYQLGFDIPFYGLMYHRIWVSANGWISFTDSTTTSYVNTSLPTSSGPAGCVCAWWDDLRPQLSGTNVRFWTNGVDSAAVTYGNVRAGTSTVGIYNFQILLTKNGDIHVMYGNMGTTRLESATIGIQNPSKTIGLTVLNSAPGVGSFVARRFAMGPRWAAVLPVAGTIASGQRDTLKLYIDGDKLCNDPSYTALHVRSNDPERPLAVIPVQAGSGLEPSVPENLTAYPVGDTIVLKWDPSSNASAYWVQRAVSGLGPFISIDTTTTTTSVITPGPGTMALFFRVIAVN